MDTKVIKTYELKDLNNLPKLIADLVKQLDHNLILFEGDLGAGKTTVIKQLLKYYSCADEGSSPSYALINEYKCPEIRIVHMDLYRLNTPEEAFQLGIEEYLYSDALCFIEWPELIKDYILTAFHLINIQINDDFTRKIQLATVDRLNK